MTKEEIGQGIEYLETLIKMEGAHGLTHADISALLKRALQGWREAETLMEENIKSLQQIARLNGDDKYSKLQDSETASWVNEMAADMAKTLGVSDIKAAQFLWDWLPEYKESIML